jgi:hypothetical protein
LLSEPRLFDQCNLMYPISTVDIPWPTSTSASPDENNPFNLDWFMSEEEQRDYLREMSLRFHTDKFSPKFRQRLDHLDGEQLFLIRGRLKTELVSSKYSQSFAGK